MQPEKSEVAGNLCHKTPIRSELGEKQTERADMHLGDKISGVSLRFVTTWKPLLCVMMIFR